MTRAEAAHKAALVAIGCVEKAMAQKLKKKLYDAARMEKIRAADVAYQQRKKAKEDARAEYTKCLISKCPIDPQDSHWLSVARIDSVGYLQICRNGKQQRLHRILMNAPKGMEVDHINGNKLDNRRSNLRVCSHLDNSKNLGVRADNKSGVTGVSYSRQRKKWFVQITVNKKILPLGRYENFADAVAVRKQFEAKHFGEYQRAS